MSDRLEPAKVSFAVTGPLATYDMTLDELLDVLEARVAGAEDARDEALLYEAQTLAINLRRILFVLSAD